MENVIVFKYFEGLKTSVILIFILLTGCGGSKDVIKGNVSGLTGSIEITNNRETISRNNDGSFAFSTDYQPGDGYNVYVSKQPANQICSIENGHGIYDPSEELDLLINCVSRDELPPYISSLFPQYLWGGAEAKLSGDNLSKTTITINGELVSPTFHNDNEIKFITPELPPGDYNIQVSNSNGAKILHTTIKSPLKAQNLTAGLNGSCAVDFENDVYCWPASIIQGGDTFEKVAIPVTDEIIKLDISKVSKLSFDHSFLTCALRLDKKVICWGNEDFSALGDGASEPSQIPVEVLGLSDVTDVSVGKFHACAITSNGEMYCWGYLNSLTPLLEPTKIAGVENAIQIESGHEHTCARTRENKVFCVGSNNFGQLGVYTSETPTIIEFSSELISLDAAGHSTCVVNANGSVICWGSNIGYTIGAQNSGQSYDSPTWASYLHGEGIEGISLGLWLGCTNYSNGDVWCWGSNRLIGNYGRLGIGTTGPGETRSDFRVGSISNAKQVVAGHFRASCALSRDSNITCWPSNFESNPQRKDYFVKDAVTVSGISNAKSLVVGDSSGYILNKEDSLYFWGKGIWNKEDRYIGHTTTPLIPFDLTDISAVNIAGKGACIRDKLDDVYCWNDYMEVNEFPWLLMKQGGLSGSQKIVGDTLFCALLNDDSVSCWTTWGNKLNLSRSPTPVSELTNIANIDSAPTSTEICAITYNNEVFCFNTQSTTPEKIEFKTNIIDIAVGKYFKCALSTNGEIYCLGGNSYGQLAVSNIEQSEEPIRIEGIDGAIQLVAGVDSACALTAGGKVYCWGGRDLSQDSAEVRLEESFYNVKSLSLYNISPTSLSYNKALLCALLHNGSVQCKGTNQDGSLGMDNGYQKANMPIMFD